MQSDEAGVSVGRCQKSDGEGVGEKAVVSDENISRDYVVVTPAFNEVTRIGKLLECVIAQVERPKRFVVVDDGSTDGTQDVVRRVTASLDWVEVLVVNRASKYDLDGASEAKAFLYGLNGIKERTALFCKLDADLTFGPAYFKDLIDRFVQNPRLGIASGSCYEMRRGRLVEERVYRQHVRGAARMYRRECYDDIGGIITGIGWDVLDLAKARMKGWETRHFSELEIVHHVPTGTKSGKRRGRMRQGRTEYLIGTHPLFLMAKYLGRMVRNPGLDSLESGLFTLWGFVASACKKERRHADEDVMRFIRREQLSRLHLGWLAN